MRPDIFIVEGLTLSDTLENNTILHQYQHTCKVHVIEVGYTSEGSIEEAETRKHEQHLQFCRELATAGWRILYPIHIIPN
jgi:hypothetical protein